MLHVRKFGWTKDVLIHQIENKTYEKYLMNQTNFDWLWIIITGIPTAKDYWQKLENAWSSTSIPPEPEDAGFQPIENKKK